MIFERCQTGGCFNCRKSFLPVRSIEYCSEANFTHATKMNANAIPANIGCRGFHFLDKTVYKTNGRPLIESLWQFTKFCRKSVVMYAKINANSSENLPGKGNMFIYYKMADNAEFSFHTVCL